MLPVFVEVMAGMFEDDEDDCGDRAAFRVGRT